MANLKVTPLNFKIESFKKFYDENFCKMMFPNEPYENILKNGTNILTWINSRINLLPIEFGVGNVYYIRLNLPSNTKPDVIEKYKKSLPIEFECIINLYEKKETNYKNKTEECEKEANPLDDENLD